MTNSRNKGAAFEREIANSLNEELNLTVPLKRILEQTREKFLPGLILGNWYLECKRYAIMTLANLAANVETRAAATRSGGLQTAVALGKDEDLDCRRYACIAMTNMANSPVTQEQLVVHGALPMILQMAEDLNDLESQRQALLALNNLLHLAL